jgi:hypothetical protein
MDHLVHLLPVYAGEYSPQHNPLSIQCGSQEDPVQQSHTHPAPVPFRTNIGDGSITSDLQCMQGPINSQGQFPCPMGEGDPIGAVQPLSAMGWVKQTLVVINQGLMQKLYNKFTTHNPHIRAATYSMVDGTQHSLIGKIERNVNPGIELAVTVQPTGRASIASFPGGNGDEQEQYMPQTSDSYKDVNLVRPRAAYQQQQTRNASWSHNNLNNKKQKGNTD